MVVLGERLVSYERGTPVSGVEPFGHSFCLGRQLGGELRCIEELRCLVTSPPYAPGMWPEILTLCYQNAPEEEKPNESLRNL